MMDGDAQELEENAGDKLESNLQQFAEQSESFKQTQEEFKEYMKALQSDINERAKVYGFIEFFDASLRDKMAKEIVDANDNVALLDDVAVLWQASILFMHLLRIFRLLLLLRIVWKNI